VNSPSAAVRTTCGSTTGSCSSFIRAGGTELLIRQGAPGRSVTGDTAAQTMDIWTKKRTAQGHWEPVVRCRPHR
jgi:hypothetical protein